MIVWVASYPRSGNSLAKQMLSSVFLIHGTTRYRARDLAALARAANSPSPPADRRVGPQFSFDFLGPWDEFRDAARAAPHEIYIKTHEPAGDDSRTIYVVRDPCAVVMSYVHFLRHNHPDLEVTPEAVIAGQLGYGSWSAHLDSWQPDRRSGTLLLRYEDMVDRPETAIAQMSRFVRVPPLRPWRTHFAELQAMRPDFYRSGSNARNASELTPAQRAMVRDVHGPWMRRLGYEAG